MRLKLNQFIFSMIILALLSVSVYALRQTLTLTVGSPNSNNLTNYTSVPLTVYVSPATNASLCTYKLGYTNGSFMSEVIMGALNNTNTTYTNSSEFIPAIDSAYNAFHNVTFNCTNSSQTTISFVKFGFVTSPVAIDTETYSIGNASSGGNNITFTFNITDPFARRCRLRLYHDSSKLYESLIDATRLENLAEIRCRATVDPEDFVKTGKYAIEAWGDNSIGNTGVTSSNKTVLVNKLEAGWNLISMTENITLSQVANQAPNISIVSYFDNELKTYTTYTVGSATNKDYRINSTKNLYVYASGDSVLVRTKMSTTTYQNSSLFVTTSTGWNQMGIRTRANFTEILSNSSGNIYKYADLPVLDVEYSSNNITYISYYNATLGKYCTARNGYTATSCSPQFNVSDIYPNEGESVWVMVDANITYDRGA